MPATLQDSLHQAKGLDNALDHVRVYPSQLFSGRTRLGELEASDYLPHIVEHLPGKLGIGSREQALPVVLIAPGRNHTLFSIKVC